MPTNIDHQLDEPLNVLKYIGTIMVSWAAMLTSWNWIQVPNPITAGGF